MPTSPLKVGDTILYLQRDDTWKEAKITSKYAKRSAWMNITDDSGNKKGIDLATGSQKYNVLIAKSIYKGLVMFIPQDKWDEYRVVEAEERNGNVGKI